jgi:hypothetical protein
MANSAPKKKARISRKSLIAVPRDVPREPGVHLDVKPHLEVDSSEFRGDPPSAESPF